VQDQYTDKLIMRTLLSITKSPYSSSTIHIGDMVTSSLESEVTLLTVTNKQSSDQKSLDELRVVSEQISSPSNILVRQGNPETEIISELNSANYNLLVIGARAHSSAPAELLLGDTTNRIVKRTPISVLIARGSIRNLNRLLVCTSGPQSDFDAIRTAIKISKHTNAQITLLHVSRAIPSMYTGLDQMGETLSDLLQTNTPTAQHLRDCASLLESEQIESEIELRHGTPTQEILRDIDRNKYDLLIIGAAKRKTISRILVDDVSIQLASKAPLPVLVVRNTIQT
jgi:nucleotide-binding universal stress UspA family protein